MNAPTPTRAPASASDAVVILYRNWRGEVAPRRIMPSPAYPQTWAEWFGSTEWHPEPQWLFRAYDLDKGAYRDFARSGVLAWGQEAVDAALASAPPAVPESVRRLSEAATQGEWYASSGTDIRTAFPEAPGKAVGMTSPVGGGNGMNDRAFIVGLVNWARSILSAPPQAETAGGDGHKIIEASEPFDGTDWALTIQWPGGRETVELVSAEAAAVLGYVAETEPTATATAGAEGGQA